MSSFREDVAKTSCLASLLIVKSSTSLNLRSLPVTVFRRTSWVPYSFFFGDLWLDERASGEGGAEGDGTATGLASADGLASGDGLGCAVGGPLGFASGLADDLLDQLVAKLQSEYGVTVNRTALEQALAF